VYNIHDHTCNEDMTFVQIYPLAMLCNVEIINKIIKNWHLKLFHDHKLLGHIGNGHY
jgi:phosphorylcholine metabolism protein LicD